RRIKQGGGDQQRARPGRGCRGRRVDRPPVRHRWRQHRRDEGRSLIPAGTMRQTDPFPIPQQGLTPTHHLDWASMARKVVRDVLRLERHERVLISADPYCGGAMLDSVRAEIQRAGAIELATMLHWTPALTLLRRPDGTRPDAVDAQVEDEAIRDLF